MKSPICEMLGIDFPLLAFSHCRDVVAAVSRAGGFGVLGATGHTLESLEMELAWIDAHVDGKPYGLDVLIPENLATGGAKGLTRASIMDKVPLEHREFVGKLAQKHHFTMPEERANSDAPAPFDPNLALEMLNVAFRHPIKLIANALGVPPQAMIDMGRERGVPVAALVGAKEHAIRQVEAGVDILVVQGGEAGGHCGEVSTMVLVPEVIRALEARGQRVPVLAAGGIMTGGQMAASMAMGADGVWTGSVWLATPESECSDVFREKMVEASSRDTVRSKSRTGKPSRQLRSAWTDAWEGPESPGPLPMPYQSLISEPAIRACDVAAQKGDPAAREMVTYFVGQGVGLVDQVRPAGQVVQDFKMEFAEAVERMTNLIGD
ncbi:NAD(P)H-dependent flavin oxidoreductase [Sphingomonas sp. IC4-52]|uniref:NAD(P)H-dependent flavin oxidoreductase n=1 Tax=Sphingomonas sp. IC4-52 TaxID=2887202 RepID=UPI001D1136AF|nr:nitronate monooxygenase family protein [Sphingomonas sp. IC4-52]MCC2980411.1 nitronate monooxygenase family protein [Sphingomonas sp. IC4-52]